MSEIKQALARLNDAIENIDAVARHTQGKFQKMQQKLATQAPQRDLFAVAGAANGTTGQIEYVPFDSEMLARKLDIAIEKVEQVLREG